MGNPGGGPGDEVERVSRLVGELLIGLGEKVRVVGPEGVRILTEEELQRHQLHWFRVGWDEHARATGRQHLEGPARPSARPGSDPGEHPDTEDFPAPPPARLLRFPERPHEGHDKD